MYVCTYVRVCRCFRVDRVTLTITKFVIKKMGEKYVQPPVLDYKNIFAQSTNMTPVVFVLSPGADPAFDVFKLGDELGFKPGTKLKYMALGQGIVLLLTNLVDYPSMCVPVDDAWTIV